MEREGKMNFLLAVFDFIFLGLISYGFFAGFFSSNSGLYFSLVLLLVVFAIVFGLKDIYKTCRYDAKHFRELFEAISVSVMILVFVQVLFTIFVRQNPIICIATAFTGFFGYFVLLIERILINLYNRFIKRTKNVLIVGAGQDGKLIAEEIQKRPELKLNVVGFLDDNMNSIEDEDSSIKILGLTCDSEAVIKDNNVKLVIIAVKSRMDSNILTDLVKGIPLGVKVIRMYRFYEKITKKFLVSKMSVNWLFYDCVRKKALIYAFLKRVCDVVSSVSILILTLPLALIIALGIKLSDFGPVFFTQMRMGKFGKPFKMVKFRTMYQDKVEDDFDDDLTEVSDDDKRIMPFGKFIRKFHLDELPQMINVLRGEMSMVGPRPVREEVYYENKESIPFWECRNWVRPGWCGWQQVIVNEPEAEQRLGYDLYYIKHQHILWDVCIFIRFVSKAITGKVCGK